MMSGFEQVERVACQDRWTKLHTEPAKKLTERKNIPGAFLYSVESMEEYKQSSAIASITVIITFLFRVCFAYR